MNLLQMSLSGAVMTLVIVVIRALAINKLPKKAFLVLWGVVAARLLIPYSFRSAFSVYSLLEQFAPMAETSNGSPAVPSTPMAPTYDVIPVPGTAAANTTVPAIVDPWAPGTAAANTTAPAAVDPWVAVWVFGVLACAVFFAVAYWKCRKEFKASLPVDNGYAKLWLSEHRIHRSIEIRQSGRISAPLTYGVFRPVILMPKTADWDDFDTLKYVLAHEYVHIRRFDAVTKLVFTVALCVHWFNPAVWIMYVLANRDIELSCDETVIREFGEGTKSAYAMALIRMEEIRSGLTPLCNSFSKNAIEERIIAIMKIKKTSLAALIIAVVLVAGVTIAFATSAKADEGAASEDLNRAPDRTAAVTEDSKNDQTGGNSDAADFFAENRIENTSPLSDILTVEYAIEDLTGFFGRASSNENALSGSSISDVRIAAADKKFPIECLRQTDAGSLYSVYKVKEGGLYYVFWAGIFDNTIGGKDAVVDWAVYFTVYLPASIKLTQNDFNSIIPNSSTAEEVAFIDPNFELCFLMSSRIASYSLLADGSIMVICYDFGAALDSRANLIVISKEVLSGAGSPSKLAAVYPYDLPGGPVFQFIGFISAVYPDTNSIAVCTDDTNFPYANDVLLYLPDDILASHFRQTSWVRITYSGVPEVVSVDNPDGSGSEKAVLYQHQLLDILDYFID